MPAPLVRLFFASDTSAQDLRRRIDDHYHLEMIAENSGQIVEYQAEAFRIQREAAIANLHGLAEIANSQDESNFLLSTILESMSDLNRNLNVQTEVLQQGFEEIARKLLQQQQTLEQIAEILSRPYETRVLELLQEATRALHTGARSTGRDQQAEFTDTTRLLNEVLANPIGSRNYVAWFQTGWLKWKFELNVAEAEEAFYQAARLSKPQADLFHANSLAHMAYMQYFQKKYSDADTAIQQALRLSPDDHDIRYDAARYATKVGRQSEALNLLEKCIDQQPHTIDLMLSEEDFSAIWEGLVALAFRKTQESRRTAKREIENWHKMLALVSRAEEQAECEIRLPSHLEDSVSEAKAQLNNADHLQALRLTKRSVAAQSEISNIARSRLEQKLESRRQDEMRISSEIAQIRGERASVLSQMTNKAKASIGEGPKFMLYAPLGCGLGVLSFIVGLILKFVMNAVYAGVKYADAPVAYFFYELIDISAVVLLILGWVIVPGVVYIIWSTKKGRIERQKEQEVSSINEESLLRQTPLEEKLKLAKKERERTEAALKTLVDNASTLAVHPP